MAFWSGSREVSIPTPSTMFFHRLLALATVVLALVLSASARMSVAHHLGVRAPLPPANDPFYVPAGDWASKPAGSILKSRQVEIAQSGVARYGVTGYQILYRTNGVDKNSPSTSVTTVLVPRNYAHDKLVAANVYEDSFSSNCAPSYSLRLGSKAFGNVAISYQSLFFTTLLSQGWVVTVPDHEGPHNAFTSGRLEGHAILDAIRATLAYDRVSLNKTAKVVGYGYSGGALASGWAASLQKQYADELNVVGWSMGGTITNLGKWLSYIDNTRGSGFALASLAGLSSSYPQLAWVKKALTSVGRQLFSEAASNCMYENLRNVGTQRIFSDRVFHGGNNFLSNSSVVSVLNKLTLGRYQKFAPTAPVFMFHAQHDEVVPYSMASKTADAWCSQGARVNFLTLTGADMAHSNTELYNLPNVIFFMRDRFNGKSFPQDCQYPSVSNPEWDINVLGTSVANLLQQVLNLLGNQIGPSDSILQSSIDDN